MNHWAVYRFYTIESWLGHTTYEDHQEVIDYFETEQEAKELTNRLNETADKSVYEYFRYRQEGEWNA